jgi:hypothetical protein
MLQKEIQNALNNFLQCYIKIYIISNLTDPLTSPIREGKLINFNYKLPYIVINLEYNKKIREFYYPIPFDCDTIENGFILDYKLNHLCQNNKELLDKIYKLPYDPENPLYNGYIIIKNDIQ